EGHACRRLRALAHAEGAGFHTETRSMGLTRRRGERGGSEGAEGCFWVYGAAETARRIQGSRGMVVCAGRVNVRGVKPASPGRLRGGMSMDPTGRNHIQYERGSGRGTLGLTKNTARPGSPPPRSPRLRVRKNSAALCEPRAAPRDTEPRRSRRNALRALR